MGILDRLLGRQTKTIRSRPQPQIAPQQKRMQPRQSPQQKHLPQQKRISQQQRRQPPPAPPPEPCAQKLPPIVPDERMQRKLETYFGRVLAAYPDREVRRLNTTRRKLAERGTALRRELGMEGQLDEFFALGGFTYHRTAGGRPPSAVDEDTLLRQLAAQFPGGLPSAAALNAADHALYLRLRAMARQAGFTMGQYLVKLYENNGHNENIPPKL